MLLQVNRLSNTIDPDTAQFNLKSKCEIRIMRKRRHPIAKCLVRNSKSAMIAAVEVHNKPLFPYRYEVCVLLVINAWELLLKAYIYKYLKGVKLFKKDGTTKQFGECLSCVSSNLGKDFQVIKESLDRLYEYRNSVAHFYSENLDLVLFSLLKANVVFYTEFIKAYFQVDLSKETNLVLLPIGFSKPFSPIDFIFNSSSLGNASAEVKVFINSIIESSKRLETLGIEESILVDFSMNLTNEKRIKNADIIAGINNANSQGNIIVIQEAPEDFRITSDPKAKERRISEEHVFQVLFTETYAAVAREARRSFSDFKQNYEFNRLMAKFKKDPNLCRVRYLNPSNPKGAKQEFYSKEIYKELAEYYTLKVVELVEPEVSSPSNAA